MRFDVYDANGRNVCTMFTPRPVSEVWTELYRLAGEQELEFWAEAGHERVGFPLRWPPSRLRNRCGPAGFKGVEDFKERSGLVVVGR